MRRKLLENSPARPWEETREEFRARMQKACRQINAEYNVEGLCRELPERLQKLKAKQGDKLKKWQPTLQVLLISLKGTLLQKFGFVGRWGSAMSKWKVLESEDL